MEEVKRAMHLSIYYLSRQQRTQKEMENYLLKKEISPEIIDSTILRLKKCNYIDDAAFAERYICSNIHKNGSRKVAFALQRKGVDPEITLDALQNADPEEEYEGALRYAQKALKGQTDLKSRQRAYASLARRGYRHEIIYRALEAARLQIDELCPSDQ